MKKPTWAKRIIRYALWLVLLIVVLFGLQLSVLAFPQLVLSNSASSGTVLLYYDGDPDPVVDQLAADVEHRLCGNRFYDSTRTDRAFFFRDLALYEFYVNLTLIPHVPQGYNLPVFGNSYVSESTVVALGQRTGGVPRYSIWEGSSAHLIAHEIGHQYVADRIGQGRWRDLPHWKQEGLPEYIANYGLIHEDSTATLRHRIGVLLSDRSWAATLGWERHGWDRIHYRAWLMIEYLFEVEGMTLEEIIAARVTEEDTYANLISWYHSPRNKGDSAI